jgi:hypothetical protein
MLVNNRTRTTSRMVLIAGFLFAGESAMSYEQPDYTVLYEDGDVEYRQYEPYLVSETVIENSDGYKDAGNEGFRRLFKYITGANQGQAKISMTAPVSQAPSEKISMTVPVQQGESADGWRVSFMLPTDYTLETAPVPTDPRVYVREVPGRLMAVLQFSGRWTEKNYTRRQTELMESVNAENINAIGEMQRAAYNAPFSLPFLRRNEVMVAVDSLPAAAEQAEGQQLAAY